MRLCPAASVAAGCWLAALLLARAPSRAAAAPPADAEPEVRREMLAYCENVRAGDNAYFSLRPVAEAERQLAAATDAQERTALRGFLGRELLKQGRTEEAIAALEHALSETRGQRRGDELESAVHWQLALAHLRRAEEVNCTSHHRAESCLVPVRPGALHPMPQHARRAGDLFLDYAQKHPRNVQAAWLLNLARRVADDWPAGVPEPLRFPAELLVAEGTAPWRDRAPRLGLVGADLAGGAVVDDLDGDGHLDLVTSTWNPCDHMKAYRNDGRGGFIEMTAEWGLADQTGGLNLMQVDADNDGRLDLLVLRGAWMLEEGRMRPSLLRNEAAAGGRLVFRDITRLSGLAEPAFPTQTAAFADYDGDGDLDLYLGAEATPAHRHPSRLLRNRGDAVFEDVTAQTGTANLRYAKGVTWGDYDNDGDPDLYVSNFGPNRLYRNDGADEGGGWRFTDVAPDLLVTEPERESFGAFFFDYDNDGDLDLYVGDYRQQAAQVTASYLGIDAGEGQPLLYRNQLVETGQPGFREVSREVGITRPAMPMGVNYGDLDNDGWLDLYLGTGEPDLASLMPNQAYRNLGGGRFEDVTLEVGLGHLQKGHGVAFGDVDGDGDQDLLHQLGGFYPGDSYQNALFENPTNTPGQPVRARFVTLRLVGARANRMGVGARVAATVELQGGARQTFHALAGSGGSFGASSLQLELGLGPARALRQIEVRWPGSGTVQTFDDVPLDARYDVHEAAAGAAGLRRAELRATPLGGSGR